MAAIGCDELVKLAGGDSGDSPAHRAACLAAMLDEGQVGYVQASDALIVARHHFEADTRTEGVNYGQAVVVLARVLR